MRLKRTKKKTEH